MNVLLFGGSFNPIHSDHILIMENLYKYKNFDEIWIIPVKKHPFKKKININNKNRIEMIEIITKDKKYIKLKKNELNNWGTSYTINTVKKMKKKYPTYTFSFIVGSDNICKIHKWKKIKLLSQICKIITIPRKNFDFFNNENIKKYNIEIIEINNLFGLSSNSIRNGINVKNQLKEINDYINKNNLYLKDRLIFNIKNDKKRYEHCINVGKMASKLAKINNINTSKAKIAGMLHDITKNWKLNLHKKYINKYLFNFINEPIPTLHSYSAYCYLKYDLLYDDDICNAVRKHTTADENMNKLDKIIFVADKISKERKYKDIKKIRKICFKNLDEGFKFLLEKQFINVLNKNKKENIGEQIIKSYNKWINQGET